ncbi:hypothetical protein E2C01_058086 [Portunus trituberculatus]|uniref:Uncharacterized protein n=1 Tax=Portunus trituberculatus TaxID=210409 RepID=A0A5B7H284_PORTR|nr:hypothetical protein [Portunus trituberculatus]
MCALGSVGSPSARVRFLSTVRVYVGLPHSGQRFPNGVQRGTWHVRGEVNVADDPVNHCQPRESTARQVVNQIHNDDNILTSLGGYDRVQMAREEGK